MIQIVFFLQFHSNDIPVIFFLLAKEEVDAIY